MTLHTSSTSVVGSVSQWPHNSRRRSQRRRMGALPWAAQRCPGPAPAIAIDHQPPQPPRTQVIRRTTSETAKKPRCTHQRRTIPHLGCLGGKGITLFTRHRHRRRHTVEKHTKTCTRSNVDARHSTVATAHTWQVGGAHCGMSPLNRYHPNK